VVKDFLLKLSLAHIRFLVTKLVFKYLNRDTSRDKVDEWYDLATKLFHCQDFILFQQQSDSHVTCIDQQ
jgi:hypothetical protein